MSEQPLQVWLDAVLGRESAQAAPEPYGLEVLRHDVGTLAFNRSTWGTPIQIGRKHYAHGLGTHCVSEIMVRLDAPGRVFEADVGMDSDPTALGRAGAVVFAVDVDGEEVFRAGPCRLGDAPLPVRVELGGTRAFTLRALDAEPGSNYADWADAAVTLENGTRLRLDAMPLLRRAVFAPDLPFSFVYAGQKSDTLLPSWKGAVAEQRDERGNDRWLVTYIDPETKLEVDWDLTVFNEHAAIEWVLHLRNTGLENTPIIENIRALSLGITTPVGGDIVLHGAHGSSCSETDFLPVDLPVPPGSEARVAAAGGRSSSGQSGGRGTKDGRLPFFNLEWGGGGLAGAVGWSGQWDLNLRREARTNFARQTERTIRLDAGQQTTRLKLHPGESIRTPRILLAAWEGERQWCGNNVLRRVLLDHYVPRRNGEIVTPPVAETSIPRAQDLTATTAENQLEAIERMAPLGPEAYWHDAAWFDGGFPDGVGNWEPRAEAYPDGLRPLGDAARERGLGFVLWFEPERVHRGTQTEREHPEWLLRVAEPSETSYCSPDDALFDLGNPEARAWLTDRLSERIADWGVTILRQDFNFDPLPYWERADAPDRQGITEIRYIEGLYALWDELRTRHPHLDIDNCSSGGRRIDLETIRRSWPLWRSDTQCWGKPVPVWDQVQTAGLSLYVPLHTAGVWAFDPYSYRSAATMGAVICSDIRSGVFPVEDAKRMIAEVKLLRPLWLGDYYPLTPITLDEAHWCGWQFDRPDLGRGFAMLFRRPRSGYATMELGLQGIEPAAEYDVRFVDTEKRQRMSGAELEQLRVHVDEPAKSLLIVYENRS